jgi:glycosyltransferase involved in cell wall biosynthesis
MVVRFGDPEVFRTLWHPRKSRAAYLPSRGRDRKPDHISVVIPCHNYGRFLGEAIESVLNQTYRRFDLIVVDDGSSDNTKEVANRYSGVRYLHQDHRGLSEARNSGLSEANGAYVVFLDADDRLLPCALEAGWKTLARHPECPLVFGCCSYIAPDGSSLARVQAYCQSVRYIDMLSRNHIFNPGSVMYRRKIFDVIGGFNSRVDPAADYELYLRISRQYPICSHAEPVVEYRLHPSNMSNNASAMLKATISVLKAEKRYANGSTEYKGASQKGIRMLLDRYRNLVLSELKLRLRANEWQEAMTTARLLIRYYPREFAGRVGRKLYRAAARRVS